ncbi:MAG: polyisoprenyl-teichoic acid--peptidoglycan teichoic acid transferase [Gaiellaceae bacterium]|nr:polyisoprenyl-teichoic acid--peptidoglycan teichoic acid transferase [Gaiellaceae bacterium]
MASGDKPYRVYRGGRTKGRVPLATRPEPGRGGDGGDGGGGKGRDRSDQPRRKRQTTWTKKTWFGFAFLLLVVVFVVWAVASYLAFRKGVEHANKRAAAAPGLQRALAAQDGLLLSRPTNILVLGTDHANTDARVGLQHSDSIMLVRTDPGRHRITYLSIPRDLRVSIPGHGDDKINAAYQIGGPALAVRTVDNLLGTPLQVNHVVLVEFDGFRKLIDDLGGVTIDVPKLLLSDKFDCPYSAARCERWKGWRFAKGPQHMSGQRALVYSRIRVAQNSNESDITRGERQQAVLQALMGKITSPGTLLRLPTRGDKLLSPLVTDLTAGQLLQLGWVKFRAPASHALHCRLGGTAATIGSQSVITGSEENIAVVHMVTGDSAPQPPPPGSGPYGPGCVVGSKSLH